MNQAVKLAEQAAQARREAKAERDAADARERQTLDWFGTVEAITRAALVASGLHQPKRQWRRKRDNMASIDPAIPTVPDSLVATPNLSPSDGKRELSSQARAILQRFKANDKTLTQREARALFEERPDLLETTGSPPFILVTNMIERYCQEGDHTTRAALYANFQRVKNDLAGPTPTATELLLAERAAICWLEVHTLEFHLNTAKGELLQVASYWIKRADSANRRFLAAVRTLAVVRKLAVPDLRISIDGRSVHFGGATTEPAPIDLDQR